MFIVIEGDNGVGKTTTSQVLMRYGYLCITENGAAKAQEQAAKKLSRTSLERYQAFLRYNQFCGSLVAQYLQQCQVAQQSNGDLSKLWKLCELYGSCVQGKALLVRYWVSTVSSAYADGILTLEQALQEAEVLEHSMPQPDLLIRLHCDFERRVARIERRQGAGVAGSANFRIAQATADAHDGAIGSYACVSEKDGLNGPNGHSGGGVGGGNCIVGNSEDDVSFQREQRYADFQARLQDKIGYMVSIDTTHLRSVQVADKILRMVAAI